jgi:hypothetical protein
MACSTCNFTCDAEKDALNDVCNAKNDLCNPKMMYVTLKMMSMTLTLQVLCRWILSVKKNYRPVKYHNWRHALNVCQTMFTVLKTGKLDRFMTELEVCFIFSIFFFCF